VLPVIGDANDLAIGEAHAPRALHLKEKGGGLVVDIDDRLRAPLEGAGDDLAARRIGRQLAALDPPSDALAFQVRSEDAEIDRDEVHRPRIERRSKTVRWLAA